MFIKKLRHAILSSCRFITFILLSAIIVFWAGLTHAQIEINAQNQSIKTPGAIYTHPQNKFSIFVPEEAQILDSKGTMDLIVQSLNGWSVNIQSSPANHTLTLEQMAGHFEAKYVGPDKIWPQKLSGEFTNTNTYSGQYEGSGSRVHVVILRTPLWDFALFFMAPEDSFITTSTIFHHMLGTFKPQIPNSNNPEYTSEITQSELGNVETIRGKYLQFRDASLGYVTFYPANWEVKKPDAYTTVFTGRAGTDENYIAISIANVAITQPAPPMSIAEGMLQQIKTQMAYSDSNVRHDRTIKISLGSGGKTSQGMQMVSTFRRGHIEYRQWSIAVTRPEGNIVYVWTYTAPLDRFHQYQVIAEKMAGSFAFIQAEPQ